MATTRRQKRMSELLREELGTLFLHETRDPRLAGVIVTAVEISPDLGQARVYVSLMSEQTEQQAALVALERASGFLRRQIADRLEMRRVPTLSFRLDDSIERSQRILDLLDQIEPTGDDEETTYEQ